MCWKLVAAALAVLLVDLVLAQHEATTTKTYDLEVPGSDPIRIIEAEPLWGRDTSQLVVPTTQRPWTDVEHRALRPTASSAAFQTRTSASASDENETEDTTQDSAEELKQFLKSYADKIRRTTKTPVEDDEEDEPGSFERFHKIELITKSPDEPSNRLANLYLNENMDGFDLEDNPQRWNLLNLKHHKHPQDDKKGWVSLEMVPWSVSKISKWHSDDIKSAVSEKPWNSKYNTPTLAKPLWSQPNKPLVNYRPGNSNYYGSLFNYGGSNKDKKPSTTFGQKVYIQPDYTDEISKPAWNKNPSHYHSQDYDSDPNCNHNNPSIITDGLPPNFPKPQLPDYNRRKGSISESEHPPSHPFNGDVLPPLKSSKVNMTTSHGGLLQVESTFQTVDEAQKLALKKQSAKKRPTKRRRPVKQAAAVVPARNIQTRKKSPNASTVLAAVGAGMIPATMAMLVPMMGRRKRDAVGPPVTPRTLDTRFKLPRLV